MASDFGYIQSRLGGCGAFAAFEQAAHRWPDNTATFGATASFTYSDTLNAAVALADQLYASDLRAGDYVGIEVSRSHQAVVAMLACARLGLCFVPLDAGYAAEQIEFILNDLPLSAVLVADHGSRVAPHLPASCLALEATALPPAKSAPATDIDGSAPLCVLYTSGTTGAPKGVVIPNRAVTQIALHHDILQINADDVVLHASTLACDGGIFECFLPLVNGAAVAIVEGQAPSLSAIADVLKTRHVTVTPWYAGLFHMMVDSHLDAFQSVRLCQAGGDVMSIPHASKLMQAHPQIALINGYGPTETFYNSLYHVVTDHDLTLDALPIGAVLTGETALVLDDDLQPVPAGTIGQLAVGGAGVALGYFGREALSHGAFVADPTGASEDRVYLTGDLARMNENGLLEFHGRADRQVKMAGRRVEIDGVEAALRHTTLVQDAAVVLNTRDAGPAQLIAFVVPTDPVADQAEFTRQLRAEANSTLHRDVFPRQIHIRDAFPLTNTGKVDRKAMLAALPENATAASTATRDTADVAATLAQVWQTVLGCAAPKANQTFFDLGGTSLQLIEAHAQIETALGCTFDIAVMFETPRFADLNARLSELSADTATTSTTPSQKPVDHAGPIAIIGMAARLPGVEDLDAFWDASLNGVSVIDHFDPNDAEDTYTPEQRARANYVPARSVLTNADAFDPAFFGMRKREAELMDPQARVFLEVCQSALDNAGVDPDRADARIGVYAGSSMSTYLHQNLLKDRDAIETFTSGFQLDYSLLAGNTQDGIATRVAFALGLHGPAIAINTACSTSLTAISVACQALRSGATDMAIAGGVSITFPQKRGYFYQEGGMASPDGRCRPFDQDAAGTVFGHGCGAILLKPLAQAQADGDHIHAVIHGIGVNNDGAAKMSYSAPSVDGQVAAIQEAHRDAGVQPSDIGYVECHGTATPLGDVIEAAALKKAFGPSEATCYLGSAKANLGHLDAAAGVVGVIKASLALTRQTVPPMAHFTALNPRIDLGGSPFTVPVSEQAWAEEMGRFAGVSSFGVGGTNVHAVLGPAPDADAEEAAKSDDLVYLPISAKSPEALAEMATAIADDVAALDQTAFADAGHTLQTGRRTFEHRACVAAATPADAATALRNASGTAAAQDTPGVAFMFPGQGAQYPGMGSDLYSTDPVYRTWIDRGAVHLEPLLGRDLRPLLLNQELSAEDAARALKETWITQPALLLTEVAMAETLRARGITPDVLVGHSVGEYAAAVIAGVMSFEDALTLIARRGRAMMDQPAGSMLAVRATSEDLAPHLTDQVDLAALNAPKMQVVAGPTDAIKELVSRLDAAGIASQQLHTSHAFHSKMMDPVTDILMEAAEAITLRAPALPIISSVTGQTLDAATATDPAYWAGQARACVNFHAAIAAVSDTKPVALLEVGPGRTLSTFAAQVLDRSSHRGIFHSLPDHARSVTDVNSVAAAISNLWCAGYPVDWSLQGHQGTRKVPLASYPFQRVRCWVDPPNTPASSTAYPVSTQEAQAVSISPSSAGDRETILLPKLAALIADLSGEDIGPDQADVSFLEFGFDSLFLGQVSQAINRDFGVTIPFRRLLSDVSTLTALSGHLAQEMPADAEIFAQAAPVVEAPAAAPAPTPAQPQIANVATAPALPTAVAPIGAGLEGVMQAQLQTMQAIFAQQLQSVGGVSVAAPAPASVAPVAAAPAPAPTAAPAPAPVTKDAPAKAPIKFGRGPAIASGFFTDAQQALIDDLVLAYSDKFAKSKAHADAHRKIHADPRTVSAFSQDWKELVFPVVSDTAKGAYLHDIDGNDFVDLVNGFGQTAFGHSPDFVTDAVTAQMGRGFPIGPQSDRAGPIAEKFARVVGHDRVTFCNTGSEAVMAAMRVARAVTGRETIVIFDKDYHGQFDEVLVKGRPNGQPGKGLPIAPGIPKSAVGNMMVLPYGTDEALNWVRDNVKDVAAVIVEPVQSRHPTLRPQEFVSELRQITRDAGAALVMDEVVTGFRVGAQGMQGAWGIQGDMATYGKVVGGGMPIGVLAGTARFMDALDGGQWQFGDDSAPETIPTFFAGTFVRHPLVLAAVDATLDHLADNGATLWEGTANRAEGLVADMKAALSARGMPDIVEAYSSWFVLKASENDPFAALLYPLMRLQGVHLLDGFCGFLTTEHGAEECAKVLTAFENALDILAAAGVFGMEPRGAASLMDLDAAKNDALIPLTESQMEIWLRHQLGGDAAAAFNESATLEVTGALDVPALKRACAALVARHDALRMVFAKDGSGFTCVEAARDVVEDHDLTTSSATLETFIDADVTRPIDITLDTPARISLARIAPDHHALVLTAHHIAADGWSFGVFFEELTALYAQETGETAANLPAAPSFARYARTRNANAAAQDQALAYWTAEFAEVPAPVDLPLDRPRPEQKTYTGGTLVHTFEPGLLARVKKGGAKQGCTLFASTFAATQILFSRLSDAENVVLGVPYAAQQDLAQSDLMGHCVQFLPIQAPIAPEATVANHMAQARDKVMTAFDNAGTTFGAIVQALKPKVEQGRVPLTEIEFNLETRASSYALPGLAAEFRGNPKKCVNFDVFFNLVETPDGLLLETHYNADLFDEETVQGWVTAYEATLNAMMENPACAIADLPIWPEAAPVVETPEPETGRVITLSDIYDRNATLWDVLAPNMAKHKSDIAVADMVSHITYGELDRTVASLAHHIQQSVPEPSARIAVCVPRGIEMLVSLLAVSRAGYTYVPLDPNQPPARLREIVEASKVSAILAMDPADVAFADDLSIIDMAAAERGEEPEPRAVNPEDPAYVIFTSGSTGTPKGVEIPHRALVNFLTSMSRAPGLTQKDRLLAVTTVMFDIAALELYLPLFVGGTVEIARTEHVVDAFKLAKRLAKGDITCMQATPTLWDMAISAGFTAPEGFKMLCGGEPLPRDLADKLVADGGTLWNMYGPTETTIWSALKNVQAGHAITIGAPIANTQLHILGKDDRAVAPGQTGELNIGGDGLALGYFGRTDLTAKAFRDVTLQGETTKLYKTGDLARMLPNGEIEVLGRIDTQVKLRGYRIELGEIESKLRALPEIDKAAVALRENQAGDKSLVGYLVAKPGADLRTTSVAQKLADNLPDYMVPRGWMVLEALPQTANGKLDRKALPDPKAMGTVTRLHDHVAPATPTETQIAAIWQEVLGQDEIGTKDTIFALGADSLSIFRIAARMLEEGLNLEARHIIAHPTIADLATFHDDRAKDGTAPARPSIVDFRGGARRRPMPGGRA